MLERLSERVGPTGSLQGEGLANLLGRPPFDPLTLALREAGQNIWDARDRSGTNARPIPKMLVRVRTLTDTQSKVLKRLIESGEELADEPHSGNLLRQCLARPEPVRVLEICDFGTIGLIGPTNPQSFVGNFVRFFFDIGSAHFDGGDGGTYGYGRSSLYLAGAARTILVDSVTASDSERRFMGARIGNSYERVIRGQPIRFTGRHFWGRVTDDRRVEPVIGRSAEGLARALGMAERTLADTGTTILVPWPDIPERDAGSRVADILLHNLWPKLVSSTGTRAMEISVEENENKIAIRDPNKHPAYSLFAQALLAARTRDEKLGAMPIQVRWPRRRTTGHIAIAQVERRPRPAEGGDQEARPERVFDRPVRHVALMRPSELVVRYLEFPGVAEELDWAGVFLCSEEKDVVKAFASSEPPAHDDWVPDRLAGTEATLVKITKLKRIPEAVNLRFGIQPGMPQPGGQPSVSLAAAADRFSSRFLAGDGDAPGRDGAGGGGGSGTSAKLKPLAFVALRVEEGKRIAQFRTAATGGQIVLVKGTAAIDGADGEKDLPEGILPPIVAGWIHPDGSQTVGETCRISRGGTYIMEVEFRGVYAIVASCEVVGS